MDKTQNTILSRKVDKGYIKCVSILVKFLKHIKDIIYGSTYM